MPIHTAPLTQVTIYTDGSCLGNPGPGGWAALLEANGKRKYIGGGFAQTTNNRMELLAVIMALRTLKRPCTVRIYTDSRYVHDAITKGWLYGWQKKNWKKADNKPVLNQDLWQQLPALLATHKTTFTWIQAHVGHVENEAVDTLAKQHAAKGNLPIDIGFAQPQDS